MLGSLVSDNLGLVNMKRPNLKSLLLVPAVVVPCLLVGCAPATYMPKPLPEGRELLTIDFKENQTLRYGFASRREVTLNWGAPKKGSGSQKEVIERSSESLEFEVAYEPIKVDPFGSSTIKATCRSAKVRRTLGRRGRRPKDAVETVAGEQFTFTVLPTGRIQDYSQLESLIKKAGEKAFRPNTSRGRVKEPDMIGDFTTTQWFLWDSVSSLEDPLAGVAVGQSWKSQLPIPNSMVLKKARDVTYTLKEIRESNEGRIAVIHSRYAAARSLDRHWPMPYTGSFQLSGPFGFLRMFAGNFTIVELTGEGEEWFNIDEGRIQQYNHKYRVDIEVGPLPLGGGTKPKMTIDQTLSMKLLGN